MTVFSGKFSQRVYDEVYARLIETAQKGKTINYGEIGKIIGYPKGSVMSSQTAKILDEINEVEHNNGRPMISSVVVNKQCGIPGDGFYILARRLGKLQGINDWEELEFWLKEIRRVFAYWKDKQ